MSDANKKAKRILLVDDHENTRILLTELLTGMGYRISEAKDGKEAMKLVEIGPIDLVMTDLKMPEMDGIELTRAIRRIKPNLPIIVYSAYRFIDTAPVALKAGANEYLAKPFLEIKIKQTVERLLKEKE
ncbi:response regulator [Patescibacteria group bacterium]|nr:response regulator [Patescibacteria group bacterium]